MFDTELLRIVRESFALEADGIHGEAHWRRVYENGMRLAAVTGADTAVVGLFALLHDSCRQGDGHDPGHGARAAEFARSLAGPALDHSGPALGLTEPQLELLEAACRGHSQGGMTGDITVLTCWDADRLDLGRVGVKPRPELLCTEAARAPELLAWAYGRSVARGQADRYR